MKTRTGTLKLDDFSNGTKSQKSPTSQWYRPIRYMPYQSSITKSYRLGLLMNDTAKHMKLVTYEALNREDQYLVKLRTDKSMIPLIYLVQECNHGGEGEYLIEAKLVGHIGSPGRQDPAWVYRLLASAEAGDAPN
jgi:hypothetical protein